MVPSNQFSSKCPNARIEIQSYLGVNRQCSNVYGHHKNKYQASKISFEKMQKFKENNPNITDDIINTYNSNDSENEEEDKPNDSNDENSKLEG